MFLPTMESESEELISSSTRISSLLFINDFVNFFWVLFSSSDSAKIFFNKIFVSLCEGCYKISNFKFLQKRKYLHLPVN